MTPMTPTSTAPSWLANAPDAYLQAYKQLPACRREILDVLLQAVEPMTTNEIAPPSKAHFNSTRTRLNELVKMRFIQKAGAKVEKLTAHTVMAYVAVMPSECEPVPLVCGPSKRAIKAVLDQVTTERDALLGKLDGFRQREKELCSLNAGWADEFCDEVLKDEDDTLASFTAEASFHAGTRLAVDALINGGITESYRHLYRRLLAKAKTDWKEFAGD